MHKTAVISIIAVVISSAVVAASSGGGGSSGVTPITTTYNTYVPTGTSVCLTGITPSSYHPPYNTSYADSDDLINLDNQFEVREPDGDWITLEHPTGEIGCAFTVYINGNAKQPGKCHTDTESEFCISEDSETVNITRDRPTPTYDEVAVVCDNCSNIMDDMRNLPQGVTQQADMYTPSNVTDLLDQPELYKSIILSTADSQSINDAFANHQSLVKDYIQDGGGLAVFGINRSTIDALPSSLQVGVKHVEKGTLLGTYMGGGEVDWVNTSERISLSPGYLPEFIGEIGLGHDLYRYEFCHDDCNGNQFYGSKGYHLLAKDDWPENPAAHTWVGKRYGDGFISLTTNKFDIFSRDSASASILKNRAIVNNILAATKNDIHSVGLTADPESLSLVPGSNQTMEFRVENDGNVLESLSFDLVGNESFVNFTQSSSTLEPGQQTTVSAGFSIPRYTEKKSEEYGFVIYRDNTAIKHHVFTLQVQNDRPSIQFLDAVPNNLTRTESFDIYCSSRDLNQRQETLNTSIFYRKPGYSDWNNSLTEWNSSVERFETSIDTAAENPAGEWSIRCNATDTHDVTGTETVEDAVSVQNDEPTLAGLNHTGNTTRLENITITTDWEDKDHAEENLSVSIDYRIDGGNWTSCPARWNKTAADWYCELEIGENDSWLGWYGLQLTADDPYEGNAGGGMGGVVAPAEFAVNNQPPTLSGLPNISVKEDSPETEAVTNITSYANDSIDDFTDSGMCLGDRCEEADIWVKNKNTSEVNCAITGNNLSVEPAADWNGNATCTVAAKDTDGGVDTDNVTVKVISVNDPPVIDNITDNITVVEGQPFHIAVNTSDIDGDQLTYSINDSRFREVQYTNANEPILGDSSASVEFEVFSDFQGPFAKRFELNTFPKIVNNYVETGETYIIWKDFPLVSIHPWSDDAAAVMECIYREDNAAFWDLKQTLYQNQSQITVDNVNTTLTDWATEEGISSTAIETCLSGGNSLQAVRENIAEGENRSVSGTPTFFVNGKKIVGAQGYETFETAIESALNNSSSSPSPIFEMNSDAVFVGKMGYDGEWHEMALLATASDNNVSVNESIGVTVLNDEDRDGVPDIRDTLAGNASTVTSSTVTPNITVNGSKDLDQSFNKTLDVEVKDGNDTLVSFAFNFSKEQLDLSGVSIEKQHSVSTVGSLLVHGLNLSGVNTTKTLYMDNVNQRVEKVCMADREISSVSSLTDDCSGASEVLLTCDGNTTNGHSCTPVKNGTKYKLTGLRHSAAQEYCPDEDNDGYRAEYCGGQDSDDNDASVNPAANQDDGGSSSSGSSGVGGGGGAPPGAFSDSENEEDTNPVIEVAADQVHIQNIHIENNGNRTFSFAPDDSSAVTEIRLESDTGLADGELTVTPIDQPVEINESVDALTTVNITHSNLSNLSAVSITFNISMEEIAEYNTTPANVSIWRYNGVWSRLTTDAHETDGAVIFTASSPGFSLYSLAADRPRDDEEQPSSRDQKKENNTNEDTKWSGPSETISPTGNLPAQPSAVAAVVLFVLLFGTLVFLNYTGRIDLRELFD